MKNTFRVVIFLVLTLGLCIATFAAESTVYVDGVGTDANCYATLADAVSAVADGGTVVLTVDYATPTGSATHLPTKSFTLTAQNGAVLTLGRTFFIYGDVVFDNITVKNGASAGVDFIYCSGYDFTVTSSVATIAKSGRYTTIFAGTSSSSKYPLVPTESEVKLYGGDWYIVSAANNTGTFTNTVDVLIDGANVHSSFYIGNYSGASEGTCNLTLVSGSLPTVKGTAGAYNIVLKGGSVESLELDATVSPEPSKTVTITSVTGTVTTSAPEGYKVVKNGTVYSTVEDVASSSTVYVGTCEGAYATLAEAVAVLSEEGGKVVIASDTAINEAFAFPEKNGDVTICSENGAKLILNANIHLANNTNGTKVIFDLPIEAVNAAIFGGFRNITFTENCTVTGKLDFYGGIDTKGLEIDTSAITELAYTITVNGGTFNNFAGGNYRADYASPVGSIVAPLTVNIGGGTFTKSFSLSGMSILADSATLTVTDGIFDCDIYAQGAKGPCSASASKYSPTVHSNRKYYAADGDIAINISGGTFSGGVWASQNEVSFYQVLRGNYSVAITGGVFADNAVMDATQVKAYADSENKATLTYAEGYTFDIVRFDNVNGEDKTYDEPLRVAFVGDSITEGPRPNIHLNSYPAVFASIAKENGKEIIVANYGSAGSGILTTSVYYPTRLAYPLAMEETDADYVFIAIGTNDNAAGLDNYLQKSYEDSLMSLTTGFGALPDPEKVFVTTALARLNENVAQIRVASVVRPLQRRVATTLEATDGDKYIFVDLYGLTLPEVAKGTLISSDNLHPSVRGYAKMGEIVYDAIFNGKKPSTYTLTDIYLSESGTPYGKGTEDDPTSRLDIAFSYAPAGDEVTLHVSGTISYNANIQTPLDIAKLNIVGEGEGATLAITDGGQFRTYSDAMFDNITLKTTVEDSYFIGMWNDITLSETVTLLGDWSFAAGYATYKRDTDATASCNTDCSVTFNGSGMFKNFMLGNLRVDTAAPFGTYSGNLTATFGNRYYVNGETVGAVGQNYLTGSISVSLPYGFACAEYAPEGTVSGTVVYDKSKNTGSVIVTNREATTNLDVVFVSETGSGDGRTPDSPMSDIAAAYTMLGEDGGTVVFVGEYTTSATVDFPAHTAKVKLTSVYGRDYRETADAAIRYKGTGFIKFNGPTEIDGLTVKLDKSSAGFCANFHSLTIGYDFAVVNTDGTTAYRMYLVGGQNGEEKDGALGATATNEIKVFSGKYLLVSAFSRNIAIEHSGTVTVTVGGTADINGLYFGAIGSGAKGGTGIVYIKENATVNNAYLSGNTTGMNGSAVLYMEDNASVGAFKNSSANYFANGTRELYYASTVSMPSDYESHFDTVTQTDAVPEGPTTIYVDGTGATEGAYATLQDAVEALNDNGGEVIVCGDTTVSGVVELAKKNGKMTITGRNGAKLTIARTFKLLSEVEFDNIELVSTSGTYGYIYAQGNKLTIGENVTTSKTDGAKWLSVLGGVSSGDVEYNSHLVIKTGTYYVVYGGNNQGTFNGTATVEISNATVTGTLSAMNYSGTFNGTSKLMIDLRGNKTVSAGKYNENEQPIFLVDNGYEAILTDGTYSQSEIKEPEAEPKTVYVDGTGKTEGAYTSLEAALSVMPGGGTVVISGNTVISAVTVLPETAAVTFTSVYDGKDYTDTAALQISANVTLGADTTFENIIIERVKNADGNYYIAAAGHKLVIEETAICLNYTGYQWLSIVGGALSGTHNGGSHLVIKGGHFRNVFGGNYKGDFYGDSKVEISGGMFENSVCGGSYIGNFTGNSYVTFGGEASMLYVTGAPAGLVGGSLGSGGSGAYTFTGDTHLTVTGGASVSTNVIGGSRGKDVSNVGDAYLTIDGTPFVYYAIYAGGYASPLDGNTYAVVNGGTLWGDFFGGSYSSTVSGNASVEINGGRVCYYKTNDASSWPEPASTKNVYGGGAEGSTLGGTATVVVNGGSIYGDVNGIAAEGATVTGKTSVTVKGGEIVGKIGTADEKVIDLSGGTSLSLGVSSSVDTLIGGGNLMIAANNLLTVKNLSGKTALSINGLPLPKKYVTVTTIADGAELNYVAQENETFTQSGNDFAIDFEGSFATTVVTVHFKEGCEVRTRVGTAESGGWMTPEASTATSATYTLEPGLHNSVVIYTSTNYQRKYFYVDGRSESMDVYVEFDAKQGIGYEARFAGQHTDQVLDAFYDTSNIEGFFIPDSPYFINHPNGSIRFTTHEETVAFLAEKQASCDYMYTFYPAKTTVRGFDFPVVIFTKDEIPEGATIADIGEIVSANEGREVVMISGGVHGCEPSGAEGALAYISELCGDYGENLFASGYLGAVIVVPNINPEGLYVYSRGTDADVANSNINRDYMALSDIASQTYTYVYQQFMPTVTIDLHESKSTPVWSDSDSMSDIYDAGLSFYSNISGPHAKTMDILYGDLSAASDNVGEEICIDALHGLEEKGMRIWFYEKNVAPNFSRNYCANLGSFSYTTEIPGTEADANYARRVFTQMALTKEIVGLAVGSKGEIARTVAAAREKTALTAQIFNARRPIVIDQATARLPGYGLYWNNPLPGPDGTIRYANNPQWTDVYNVAARYRSLPTGYVLSADLANIEGVLALLDRHGIAYTYLAEGSTLTLSQYSGTQTRAIVGAEQAYTFENGAYLIPVDGCRAYLTSFLFEPDNTDITEGVGTLVQCGYLTVSDIYRSTESYIGAKYGAVGTYVEISTEGKTVANAVVDGVTYESVATEGENAYVVNAEDTVVLNFTDGTSKTYIYRDIPGDIDRDGNVTVKDILILIRVVVNDQTIENGDLNGDGKISLIDVIRVMKLIAQ